MERRRPLTGVMTARAHLSLLVVVVGSFPATWLLGRAGGWAGLLTPLVAEKNKSLKDGLASLAKKPQIKNASRLAEIPDARAAVFTLNVEG